MENQKPYVRIKGRGFRPFIARFIGVQARQQRHFKKEELKVKPEPRQKVLEAKNEFEILDIKGGED